MISAPSPQELEAFQDLVAGHLGLDFHDARADELGAALRQRLAATRSDAAAYLRRLAGPDAHAEVRALARLLTVGETHFLRSHEQLRALVEIAVPERMRARGGLRRLRLLSAGCSSGEEPHSIAIVLREALPELVSTWDVRIVGIDVNPERLAHGRAGRYASWSLRGVPDAVRARWFRPSGREHLLDASIQGAVTLEERNLLRDDPAFWQEGAFDVVFFRNVAMYLTRDVLRAVVSRIARALAPGGFLFLGHAEHLRGVSDDFHLRQSHECFYYQRRAADDAPDADAPPPAPRAPGLAAGGSWVDAIQRAADRIAALEAGPELAPAPPPPASPSPSASHAAALELLAQERIADAIEALPPEAASDADALLLRAVLLASCGRRAEAEVVCAEILRRDHLDAGAHYVAALCREHAGDGIGARDHDRRAAYLDPSFAMPRLHLGLLARRAGELEVARHELRRAELLLQREEPSRVLLFGGGFRREGLVQLCRAELAACGVGP